VTLVESRVDDFDMANIALAEDLPTGVTPRLELVSNLPVRLSGRRVSNAVFVDEMDEERWIPTFRVARKRYRKRFTLLMLRTYLSSCKWLKI